jgi:hypothetical protein
MSTYVVILLLGSITYIAYLIVMAAIGAAIGAALAPSTTDTDRNDR